RALPSAGLFRSGGTPPFLLDALLLDAASQVVGYWTAEFLERDFVVFPIGLDRLEIFAAPLAPPATARCRTRCDVRSDGTIRADLEIAGPDGRLLARLSGWEVKRIRLPERIYAFRLAPRDVLLSDPLPAPDPADDGVRCCRLEIDDRLLVADGGIWREGLAHLALAREEREAWRALSGSEARRGEWLVGRLAAKDAVRLFLKARHGLAVYPADVVIQSEGPGRPVAAGPWVETIGQAPALSLSHSNGLAVAIAGQGRARGGVGIDVERLRRTAPGFEDLAFTAGERDLLHALAQGDRDEWTLRLWCAKEAAAKALGSGLRGDPRRFEARAIDAGRGTVHLDVAGVTAGDLPGLAGSTLTAWTGRDGDVIVATAL
ncbi:MAG TPA: 4'-phosphopantetheinyl transferase superfamily protein, partial [Candidatus Polarisedimenticolia bacterium]|nr:4'-phosphopantetheinyl transferase superfamily protein [Candidatus Polarisedimenticolia bacterium]